MAAKARGAAAPSSSGKGKTKATKKKTAQSGGPPHPPAPPPPASVALDPVDDDDDDAPEEMTSRVVRDDHQEHKAPAAATAKGKKRPRKTKAREEKYWAAKEAGEDVVEAAAAPAEEEEEELEGPISKKAKNASAAAPLSMALLESAQRAKEADQQRRVHEALQVIELARQKSQAEERRKKPKKQKQATRVFGNIRVATVSGLQEAAEETPEVPAEVLDFARTQGRTSGNAQKRVPFVAFAKAKPAVAVQRKGVRAVKRGGRGN